MLRDISIWIVSLLYTNLANLTAEATVNAGYSCQQLLLCTTQGGGGGKKIRANFFSYPPPPPGEPSEKKAGTPCRNFIFARRNFFTVCYLNLHGTFTLPHCMTLAHELLLR